MRYRLPVYTTRPAPRPVRLWPRLALTLLCLVLFLALVLLLRAQAEAAESGPPLPVASLADQAATFTFYRVEFWQQATCRTPLGSLVGTIRHYGPVWGGGLEVRVNGRRYIIRAAPVALFAAPTAPGDIPDWYVNGRAAGGTLVLTAYGARCRVGPLP